MCSPWLNCEWIQFQEGNLDSSVFLTWLLGEINSAMREKKRLLNPSDLFDESLFSASFHFYLLLFSMMMMTEKWHNIVFCAKQFSWNFMTVTTHTKILRKETSRREKHVKRKYQFCFKSNMIFVPWLGGMKTRPKRAAFIVLFISVLEHREGERRQLYFCYRKEKCNKNFTNSSIACRSTSIMLMFMAIDDYFVLSLSLYLYLIVFSFMATRLSLSNNNNIRNWRGKTAKR